MRTLVVVAGFSTLLLAAITLGLWRRSRSKLRFAKLSRHMRKRKRTTTEPRGSWVTREVQD